MIKRSVLLLSGSLFLTSLSAQDLPEKTLWQGQLGPVRLILRVFPDSLSGIQKAVFDSPDQNAINLAISDFKVTADSLLAFSKVIGGGFTGKFNDSKTQIIGGWKQGKVNAPLTLIRITSLAAAVARPKPLKRHILTNLKM